MENLAHSNIGSIQISFKKILWLYFIILPLFAIDFANVNTNTALWSTILTILTVGIGHSVGLHRGIIHKTYKTSRWFRNLSVYLFVLTGLGSPKSWLKLHYFRDYWQNRTDCPKYFGYKHSLIKDYWWNLHLGFTAKNIDIYNIPNEDLEDKWIEWLHKTWWLHNIILMVLVYSIWNIDVMLIVMNLRIAITILGHWYIGYASHKFGYSRYSIENADESGYNDVILGLISFGEGFHNNHHAHPKSAKFSMKWYEIDFGWYLIALLKKFNIIHHVTEHGKVETKKVTAISFKKVKWVMPWK